MRILEFCYFPSIGSHIFLIPSPMLVYDKNHSNICIGFMFLDFVVGVIINFKKPQQ